MPLVFMMWYSFAVDLGAALGPILAYLLNDMWGISVARCGGFYLRDIVEEKCRLRPACRKLPGLSREKT